MATSRICPTSWSLPVGTLVGRAWICPWETSTVVAPPLQPPLPFAWVALESTVTRPSIGGTADMSPTTMEVPAPPVASALQP